jgi:PIN domain nuclease of toxin-antitoxin system
MTFVLDACAIIAVLNAEEGADKVMDVLERAEAGAVSVLMHRANLLEVYYDRWKALDADVAQATLRKIHASPITIVQPVATDLLSDAFLHEAARFKVVYGMPLGDCFLCATASVSKGTIVTSDHTDLDPVEEAEQFPFLWIRPKPETKPKTPRRTLEEAEQAFAEAKRRLAEAQRRIAELEGKK